MTTTLSDDVLKIRTFTLQVVDITWSVINSHPKYLCNSCGFSTTYKKVQLISSITCRLLTKISKESWPLGYGGVWGPKQQMLSQCYPLRDLKDRWITFDKPEALNKQRRYKLITNSLRWDRNKSAIKFLLKYIPVRCGVIECIFLSNCSNMFFFFRKIINFGQKKTIAYKTGFKYNSELSITHSDLK